MSKNRFPDWSTIYKEQDVKEMPWYFPELDPDLAETLRRKKFSAGAFLDLGSGPGTQAAALAKMGFSVTGMDLAADAVAKAKAEFQGVDFIQDDILDLKTKRRFDFIFDRGCFHVFQAAQRKAYVTTVSDLLNSTGHLFLKCFSDKMPDTGLGPYRFSPAAIHGLFDGKFVIENIAETVFQGIRTPPPKALFIAMRKK